MKGNDWYESAKCLGSDFNIYYEVYEENESVRGAVDKQCSECAVRKQCFANGINGKETGVWGGVYLDEGVPSKEFNSHKSPKDWATTWRALTMEE